MEEKYNLHLEFELANRQSTKHLAVDCFFFVFLEFLVFLELGKQSVEILDTLLIFTTLLNSKTNISSALLPIYKTFIGTGSPVYDFDIWVNCLLKMHVTPCKG